MRDGAVARLLVFCISLLLCTLFFTVIWQCYVADHLYHCTDDAGFLDYLAGPSSWVHGNVAGQPGNYGDTVKAGWSLRGIECLWFGTLLLSAIVSLIAASVCYQRWVIVPSRSAAVARRCPSCGYDLRATPERCPECGMTTHGGPSPEGTS